MIRTAVATMPEPAPAPGRRGIPRIGKEPSMTPAMTLQALAPLGRLRAMALAARQRRLDEEAELARQRREEERERQREEKAARRLELADDLVRRVRDAFHVRAEIGEVRFQRTGAGDVPYLELPDGITMMPGTFPATLHIGHGGHGYVDAKGNWYEVQRLDQLGDFYSVLDAAAEAGDGL